MTPSKSEIKLIRSLARRKIREENGLFVVEGEKLVQEAIESGWDILEVFRMEEIGEQLMSRITLLSSPSPALAVIRIPQTSYSLTPDINNLSIALDSIKDPGNLGTIVRLSEWFGIDTIYCSENCVDIYNPKAVQSTMGAIFRTKVVYTHLPGLIKEIEGMMPVYGTFMNGSNIYGQSLPKGALVVMGSESDGISPEVEALINKKLSIPSFSLNEKSSESLNVAIATAVICSEFKRSSV
ncbi:MAG TPA: RNA methyltransferase [Rikenellaceae bacterium]|nr:RNA methyltransferase [Rikenellaceae bacterium]